MSTKEVLKKIVEICVQQETCNTCPFGQLGYDDHCPFDSGFETGTPNAWKINTRTVITLD